MPTGDYPWVNSTVTTTTGLPDWWTNNTLATTTTATWAPPMLTFNGPVQDGTWFLQNPTVIYQPDLTFKNICAPEVEQEEEMGMPFYILMDDSGNMIEKVKEEADAKRKAKQYASNQKKDVYVLKPAFRYEPKDVPVEEVPL
jgi:hypothetical protein